MRAYLFVGDGVLGGLVQLLDRLGVVAQITLAANQDDGKARAEVQDLRDPLRGTVSTGSVTADCKIRHSPSPGRCRASRASPRRNRSK